MDRLRHGRVPEILFALTLNGLALSMNRVLPIHQRMVPEVVLAVPSVDGTIQHITARDPALSFPLVHEQLPLGVALVLCIAIPLVCLLCAKCVFDVPKTFVRDVCIAWLQGHAVNNTITHIAKCVFGRPRPNFYALVEAGKITTARKSFPSGHASSAATSMVMLSLLLVELLRHDPRFQRRGIRSFGARFASVALPSLFVMWVGATRTQDHYHTFGDVLAGCVVGTMSAAAAHSMESLPQLIAQGGVNSATGLMSMLRDSARGHGSSGDGAARPVSVDQLRFCIPSTPSREQDDQFSTWPTPKARPDGHNGDLMAGSLITPGSASSLHFRQARSAASQTSVLSHGI